MFLTWISRRKKEKLFAINFHVDYERRKCFRNFINLWYSKSFFKVLFCNLLVGGIRWIVTMNYGFLRALHELPVIFHLETRSIIQLVVIYLFQIFLVTKIKTSELTLSFNCNPQKRVLAEKPHFFISSNSNLFFIAQEKKWIIVCVFRGKNLLWGKFFVFGITNKHAFYLVHFEENPIFEWILFPENLLKKKFAENSFSMLWEELIASATNRWNVLAEDSPMSLFILNDWEFSRTKEFSCHIFKTVTLMKF